MASEEMESLRDALRQGYPAEELEERLVAAYPNLRAFHENDDLVLVAGDVRRLLVRRVAPERFVLGDVAAASGSTNMLDTGGEAERDVDGLLREIDGFAAV